MENKKIITLILAGILSITIITTCYFIAKNRQKQNTKIYKEDTYTMYIKTNSVLKITFTEKYALCNNNKNKACSKRFYNVTKYDLIDDNAKKVYKNINLEDKSLYEAILILCDITYSNEIPFNKVEITTNNKNLDDTDIIKYLKENSKNKISFSINLDYQENITENAVFKKEKDPIKTYVVTFNSDGGSYIDVQSIEEGKKASKPNNPTRAGYIFVEWQLNGKLYDFNSIITNDITLKAVWKKVTNNKEIQDKEVNNQSTEPEKNTETEIEPSPVPPVEDNPVQPETTPNVPEETPTVPEETPKEPEETTNPENTQPNQE